MTAAAIEPAAPRERPILFSAPMVRALLAGRKTQTRRIVDPARHTTDPARCPYGVPGDRLWVREAWKTSVQLNAKNATQIAEACDEANYDRPWAPILYQADGEEKDWDTQWGAPGRQRLARFMPRWLSRLTLEVTDVRVQRVGDIGEDDAKAEGVLPFGLVFESVSLDQPLTDGARAGDAPYRALYAVLWDSINGDRALWKSSPWVWAISFKVVSQ